MGFNYDHAIVYVPTRHNLERFIDMPPMPQRITGENIPANVEQLLNSEGDRDQWLWRLQASGAQYLVVSRINPAKPEQKVIPPEMWFAEMDVAHFKLIFGNDSAPGMIYEIHWGP